MSRVLHLLLLASLVAAALPAAAAPPDPEARDELVRLDPILGRAITMADLEGRVVAVVFFASWCPPCREEFPLLDRVQAAYAAAGLQIVAINVFEAYDGLSTPAKLEAFLDDQAPTFPVLLGDRAIRAAFGNLDRIPSLFLFARDGRLAMTFRYERGSTKTYLTEAELRAAVEPLL